MSTSNNNTTATNVHETGTAQPNNNTTATNVHETGTAQPNHNTPATNVHDTGTAQPNNNTTATNVRETDTAQPTGAYDNQRYPDQSPAYPLQGQQPASLGQHTTPTNVHGTGTAQPTGAYDNQRYPDHNPAYPPQGQQPQATPIGQQDPNHGYGGTIGQDSTQINQGQYGAAPPTSFSNFGHGAPGAGGQRVGDPAVPPVNNNNSNNPDSNLSFTQKIGKVQSAIGSLIGNDSLQAKGLQREQGTNTSRIQDEIAEAERLEKQALIHRKRAVDEGAHPSNLMLGGQPRPYN
jgi:uncharacterized protein YjbJ (UPF0337 family)